MKKVFFIAVICLLSSISVFSQSKRTWEKTKSLNSITAYEDFLKKYPVGEFTNEAEKKLTKLILGLPNRLKT